MAIIELSGGFHNSWPITAIVKDADLQYYRDGRCDLNFMLSDSQKKKLRRHFCGIAGCQCGSYMRATVVIINKKKRGKK